MLPFGYCHFINVIRKVKTRSPGQHHGALVRLAYNWSKRTHTHTAGGDIWSHSAGDHGPSRGRGDRVLRLQTDPAGCLRVRSGSDRPREVAGESGFRRRLRQRLLHALVRQKMRSVRRREGCTTFLGVLLP